MSNGVENRERISNSFRYGKDITCRAKLKDVFERVEIRDLLVVLASLCAIFNYGSSWTGLTGSQLTLLRLAIALFACLLIGLRFPWKSLELYEKAGLAYCGFVFIEGLFGRISPGSAWVEGITGALLFVVPSQLRRKYGKDLAGLIICLMTCLIIALVDIFAIATAGRGFVTQDNEFLFSSNYLIGDKFLLAYMNMLCFALLYWRFPSVQSLILFGTISLFVCSVIECSTGVTGTIIMIVVIALSYPVRVVPAGCFFLPATTVVLAVVAVAFTGLLTWGPFGHFITNFLGESSDLTGRTMIYPVLMSLFLKKPLFGYLTGNGANQAVTAACGAADAQEGLFHILLTNGLMDVVLFLIMECTALRDACSMHRREQGVYAFIFAMTACSVVEINLGLPLLLGLSFFAMSLTSDE